MTVVKTNYYYYPVEDLVMVEQLHKNRKITFTKIRVSELLNYLEEQGAIDEYRGQHLRD